jgi:intracellular multiplication protein IcmL
VVDTNVKKSKLDFLLEKGVPFLVKIYLISIIINIFAALSIFYVYSNPPEPNYYSTSVNGLSSKLEPLNNPNTSDSVVTQWANLACIGAFTYDFVNYQAQLETASEYFTKDGWDNFMQSLQDSNNLNTVISKKLVVSAVALTPPLILKKGVVNGVYAWRIQLPILVTYQSASDVTQMKMIVNMLMTRISTRENYKGVGVAQFSSAGYYGNELGLNI